MMPPKKTKYYDDFQTPEFALDILVPYLRKEWIIWECASGKGNLVRGLIKRGFKVIGTDIIHGFDFFKWTPKKFDCIVTNPPYSMKDRFLERAYELGKPFALLLPITALEGERRQRLFRKYGIQLIIPNKRINFETPSGKGSGSWFLSVWFTWGLDLPKELNFVKVKW